jgi:hypothetical protein
MTCPAPENHKAVVLYCLSPLAKDILSDATKQALVDSPAERMDELQDRRDQLTGLRITRVFSCVARGFKARVSFGFGECGWR